MCGICGYTGDNNEAVMERMLLALRHRGPDAQGIWQNPGGNVHFGHRRLSILDLTGGAQPMSTADGRLTITFNGEIYNFRELRGELEILGHRFLSDHSDTEVLLHGYREWGATLPSHLNGMWAFVIHDAQQHRLFASRDRFGKKPLYFFFQQGVFAFASELTSLRQHPGCPTSVSRQALRKLFAYGYIPSPVSILEGVSKLPAAHNLQFDLSRRSLSVERYWRYEMEPNDPPQSKAALDQLAEALLERLQKAVALRMVADVPVGIFLSGGIDSSTVAALAARSSTRPVETFTIGFEEPSFDESSFAALAASHFGTNHHTQTLSIERARELVPQVLGHLDEPFGDASILPTALLSAFAREKVTVALGGDGGDELLAGYDPFAALEKAVLYERFIPKPVHRAISFLAAKLPVSHRNMSFDFKLKRTLRGLNYPPKLWLPVWMAPLSIPELSDLFAEPVDPEELYSEAIAIWDSCPQSDLVSKTIQYYVNLYLQDDILTKTDRASMMYSLEVRSPFLDLGVMDFIRHLHPAVLYRQNTRKFLLKHAVINLLPKELIIRKKKGFGIPAGRWFQSGFYTITPIRECVGINIKMLDYQYISGRLKHGDFWGLFWLVLSVNHWF